MPRMHARRQGVRQAGKNDSKVAKAQIGDMSRFGIAAPATLRGDRSPWDVTPSRRAVSLVAVFLGLMPGCGTDADEGAEPPEDLQTCTIAHLSDGDSLLCNEKNERIRLLLIDAPEMAQRPWGDSARAALEALAPEGTAVRVEYDVQRRDDFDRLLAYLWLADGRLVNEEMARGGYVVLLYYPPNNKYRERIRSAVEDARDAGRGLWATSAFDCLPVDFRAGRCGTD